MMITPIPVPQPQITLENNPLELVHTYKYLGININDKLDWDDQWLRVQKQTQSIPYLIKTMNRLGFNEKTLVNTYRSLALSHFIYSAPLLSFSNSKVRSEMTSLQNRVLRIINITKEEARKQYKITTIDDLIKQTNHKIMDNITADHNHPITQKLTKIKRLRKTRSNFNLKIDKLRTTAYAKKKKIN